MSVAKTKKTKKKRQRATQEFAEVAKQVSDSVEKTWESKREVGESHLEKRLGKLPLVKFKIIQGGKEIEPWKGKAASIMEWMRNSSAMMGEVREETATYWKIEKDSPIYYEDTLAPDMKMDLAWFSSEKDGTHYNVSARLVPSSIKPGDRCRLHILGCCSISNVDKA